MTEPTEPIDTGGPTCPTCAGKGELSQDDIDRSPSLLADVVPGQVCPSCGGTGEITGGEVNTMSSATGQSAGAPFTRHSPTSINATQQVP